MCIREPTIQKIMTLQEQLINDNRLLNVYLFGSTVYGSTDKHSDIDYICVAKEWFDPMNVNIHVFSVNQFQLLLDNCDIQTLECVFLPAEFKLKEHHTFQLRLDKFLLRTSISTIASNSWVKGKKKLTVMGDYDLRLALKSIFHSLRILDFAIQVATDEKISNYKSMNYVLDDLWKLSKDYNYSELWAVIDLKYRKLFNELSTHFKQLCPKNATQLSRKERLKTILDNHGCYSVELLQDLLDEY
jgi:hypothetical protein